MANTVDSRKEFIFAVGGISSLGFIISFLHRLRSKTQEVGNELALEVEMASCSQADRLGLMIK